MLSPSAAVLAASQASPFEARARRLLRQLNCFPVTFRPAVIAVADSDPRLADLAFSFPALLFVIAVTHRGRDRAMLAHAVRAGVPLKRLAELSGLPWWTRKLPPQAFSRLIGPLPEDELVNSQIAQFVPRRARHCAQWLCDVSDAARWGTDSFALWVAKTYEAGRSRGWHHHQRKLALWAWFSAHPDTEAGKLCRKPFKLSMTLKGANEHHNAWVESFNLHVILWPAARLPLLRAARVDGFDFVHLADTAMLAEEAQRMSNCIMTYGEDISGDGMELWSVRRDGASVATLSVGRSWADHLAAITEIKGPQNQDVSREVALAARRWFACHDLESVSPVTAGQNLQRPLKAWQHLLKPYWLAKREPDIWPERASQWLSLSKAFLVRRQRRRQR